ncbi:MAG: hypothetical protein AB7U82_04560 [Blastocatellales bacterium]
MPRHSIPLPRKRVFTRDLLDPSSAWALDEYAVTLPVTSEPYDWMLEDDATPFPQFVPVPPPAWGSQAMLRQAKRKANLSEAALLIPIKRTAPGNCAEKNRTRPRRKHLISSVLLLMLAVVAVFIFAYIAQKYGR